MKENWSVTYEIWDEESSECGESDDKGFVYEDCSFRQAVKECGGIHASYEPSSSDLKSNRWFTNDNYNEDYRTGVTEQRSFHIPEHITEASRVRIAKLLKVRGA